MDEKEKLDSRDVQNIIRIIIPTTIINTVLFVFNWIAFFYWGWAWVWTLLAIPMTLANMSFNRIDFDDVSHYFSKAYCGDLMSKADRIIRDLLTANVIYWGLSICFWLFQILANLGNIKFCGA